MLGRRRRPRPPDYPDRRRDQASPPKTTSKKLSSAGPITNKERNGRSTDAADSRLPRTIRGRAQTDAAFRQSLLLETVECLFNGGSPPERPFFATTSTPQPVFRIWKSAPEFQRKSLMRMLGSQGSPSAKNPSAILTSLQKAEGVSFKLSLKC